MQDQRRHRRPKRGVSACKRLLAHEAERRTLHAESESNCHNRTREAIRADGSRAAGISGSAESPATAEAAEPRDQLEAMLAAQMAAVHNATMTFARRLNHVDNIPQQDSAERAFNKLARTFASQLEALKRYRSTGKQTVRVEHVTVNEGGQAIVGNVAHGGRGLPDKMGPTS